MLDKELLVRTKISRHKCPRCNGPTAGLAAMGKLGVKHAPDGQLETILELDEEHCATCFADGVQVATGCTYGKGISSASVTQMGPDSD